ncbi:Uncharacterised protein [Mycobacteroides abscessus]|nr:Uncharacterised protein [Mycobacteroides abscessus]
MRVAPTSGRPSGVTGREPTHSSCLSSRSTPWNRCRTDARIASIRRGWSGSSGPRNSMVPAMRNRPW